MGIAILSFILSVVIESNISIYIGMILLAVSLIINQKRLGKYTYILGNPDRRHEGFPSEGTTIMNESYTLDKRSNKRKAKEKKQ